MLAWPVDNANIVYVGLGLIVLGLSVAWWLNRRVKTLVIIAGIIALGALCWLLTLVVPTDRKQIQENVWTMRRAVLDRKPDDLAKHWAKDFGFQSLTGESLAQAVTKGAADFRVDDIHLWDFDVKSVAEDKAEIWFRCRATGRDGAPFLALCKTDFVKESESWKLQRVRFFNAVANTDQQIPLPIGR